MERGDDPHALLPPKRLHQVAVQVALRAHLARVPPVHVAVPQAEPVVMHHRDARVPRARRGDQVGPRARVVAFGLEQRDEVLVAELRLVAVCLAVMLEHAGAVLLVVHPLGVPLVAEGRHGVDAPVRVDAELRVAQPRGHGVARQRLPGRLVHLGLRSAPRGRNHQARSRQHDRRGRENASRCVAHRCTSILSAGAGRAACRPRRSRALPRSSYPRASPQATGAARRAGYAVAWNGQARRGPSDIPVCLRASLCPCG